MHSPMRACFLPSKMDVKVNIFKKMIGVYSNISEPKKVIYRYLVLNTIVHEVNLYILNGSIKRVYDVLRSYFLSTYFHVFGDMFHIIFTFSFFPIVGAHCGP